jgi:translocation and assembly module TamA
MPFPLRLAAAAVILLTCGAAQAAKVERVDIQGLDEAMTLNVRVSLSLVDAIGKEVPGRRLAYLLREAGYYSPTITISDSRGPRAPGGNDAVANAGPATQTDPVATEATVAGTDATATDDSATTSVPPAATPGPEATPQTEENSTRAPRAPVTVTIQVDPGEPVRVRNADIAILGEGAGDRYLKEDLGAFTPNEGAVFNHATYEASKTRITRRLTERGYFDADFTAHRVEVTRADQAADIELVWTSGDRYDMGPTTFTQAPKRIIRESLLEKLVYWEEGEYFHQGRLDRLRKSLVALDYFSRIDIEARPEDAVDKRVPVQVTLTPAKRSVYTSGVSYGTESGAGIRLGVERRYLNSRGHKALAQLDYAQKRKTLTLQYRVPAFAWLDGWYTASLQAADEQTDYIDDRRIEFVASRSGQFNRNLNLVASLHALRERWAYAADADDDPETPVLYRYATFTFPSLRAEYIDVDDRVFPRSGIGGSLLLRGGVEGAGSDANFGQVHARATWFKGLGARNRLIVRGELGHTFTDALVDLPPSLRFFAGGDRSIRGYEYREVGPRLPPAPGRKAFSVGGKNLVTASVEFERYFTQALGGAVFVDSGDAFDGSTPNWRTGVGVGVRYRSPVGPVKLDLARGLDDPDSSFTIGLSIGAEF